MLDKNLINEELNDYMTRILFFQIGFIFNALVTRLSKNPIPEDIVFVIPLFCLAIISTILTLVQDQHT